MLALKRSGVYSKISKPIPDGLHVSPQDSKDNRPRIVPQLGHKAPIDQIYIRRDSNYILTIDKEALFALLWEVSSGKIIRKYTMDNQPILSAAFSPRGNLIALGGKKWIKVYDLQSEDQARYEKLKINRPCASLVFSHNEKYLFFPDNQKLKVWNYTKPGEKAEDFDCGEFSSNMALRTLAISTDGHMIVGGLDQGKREKNEKWWGIALWRQDWMQNNDKLNEKLGLDPSKTPPFSVKKILIDKSGQYLLVCLEPEDEEKGYWPFLIDVNQKLNDYATEVLPQKNSEQSKNLNPWYEKVIGLERLSKKSPRYDFAHFSPGGDYILLGKEGEMFKWDMRDQEIIPISQGCYYDGDNNLPLIFTHDLKYYFAVDQEQSKPNYPVLTMRRIVDGEKIRQFAGVRQRPDDELREVLKDLCQRIRKEDALDLGSYKFTNGLTKFKSRASGTDKEVKILMICPEPDDKVEETEQAPEYVLLSLKEETREDYKDESKKVKEEIVEYYASSRDSCRSLAFVKQNRAFEYDQFDVEFNKPHLVFQKFTDYFKPESPFIQQMERAFSYRKAIMKSALDLEEGPEITVLSSIPIDVVEKSESLIPISIRIRQKKSRQSPEKPPLLDRLDVWVNGVPLVGLNGVSLKERYTRDTVVNTQIQLSKGRNKVRISAMNQKGLRSLNENYEIFFREKKPDLFLYAIGVSNYDDEDYRLDFAHKDAMDIAEKYRDRARQTDKFFGTLKVQVFTNQQVAQDENSNSSQASAINHKVAVRDNILAIREELKELSDVDDVVVVFFAGHGVRNENADLFLAPCDMDFDRPEKRGVSYQQIVGLLDDVPARNKLLLLDACFTGELARLEDNTIKQKAALPVGFSDFNQELAAEDFPETNPLSQEMTFNRELDDDPSREIAKFTQQTFDQMQSLFVDLRRHTGANVLTSTSGDRFAFERSSLKNGVFTSCLKEVFADFEIGSRKNTPLMASQLKGKIQTKFTDLITGQQPKLRDQNLENDFQIW